MQHLPLVLADLVAISVLVLAVYHPRHRRKDLAVAFFGVNVGVMAVAVVLSGTTVGAGLGLGLFGVLSIIRLRSTELSQREVAYYFVALALGLVSGLGATSVAVTAALLAGLVAVLAVVDAPGFLGRDRERLVVLDAAYTDDVALADAVERLLGVRPHTLDVVRLDLVNDSTTVTVRFREPRGGRAVAGDAALPVAVTA